MNAATRSMVLGWLADHHGDAEAVARFMSRTLRIGGIRICRKMIAEATATSATQDFNARIEAGAYSRPASARCVIWLDTCRPVGGVK